MQQTMAGATRAHARPATTHPTRDHFAPTRSNPTRPHFYRHAFLDLFPPGERADVYDLFWCAAATLHTPAECLRHVHLMCQSFWLEPDMLDGDTLLLAKRVTVNALRYPDLARGLLSSLMVIEDAMQSLAEGGTR